MNCKITINSLCVSLPITTPTGKVRVKRPVSGGESEPVACRSDNINDGDYLEWQISYDTDSLNLPSVLRDVVLNKEQGVRYGCELAWLVRQARDKGILPHAEFSRLRDMVNAPLENGVEESELILRAVDKVANTIATRAGFTRNILQVPNYLKKTELYGVEIKIAHKQRAVGNQAMIFVNLPVNACKSQNSRPLIGRCADKLEQVDYTIDANNAGLISDTVVAFAIASQSHRDDLKMIFEKL